MENWIVIEVFNVFSARANGALGIIFLTVVILGMAAFGLLPKQRG